MDKITRWEWHGSPIILVLLCFILPLGVMYFMSHLIKIESEVKDATELSDFLSKR